MSQLPRENFDSQQLNASIPQNTIEGDRNRAVQGNDNKAVIGDENTVIEGNNNLMLTIKELILRQPATFGNPVRPGNQRKLLAEVKKEVIWRLEQSLHNAVLINLGKELQPQQVKCPWDAEIKIGQKPAKPLADNTSIISVFDDSAIAGKLLILGAPGSGKTTTLLELTQTLVNRAQEQPDYPIPVLFNLPSWKDDCQSLTDWLVDELKSKYHILEKLGKEWLENHQLLPMLDGLDELAANRQESCVVAINQFLQSEYRPQFLVVCSRYEEYSNYETLLSINGAICLQPLAEAKIRNYLIDVGQKKLWQTFQNDSTLLELMKTPFFLSISVLCAAELDQINWHELSSTEAKVEHLLDAYIRQMLSRPNSSNTKDAKQKTPSWRQTRYWLAYLASQLNKTNSSEFLIERMQFSWLGKKDRKSFSKLHTKFSNYFIFISITACFLVIFVFMFFPKQLDYLSKLIPESILLLLSPIVIIVFNIFFIYSIALQTFLINPFQKKIATVEKIEWKLNTNELLFPQFLVGGFLFSIYGLICQYIGGFITSLNPIPSESMNGTTQVGVGGLIVGSFICLVLIIYELFSANRKKLEINENPCFIILRGCFTGAILGCLAEVFGWLNFSIFWGVSFGILGLFLDIISAIKFKSELQHTSKIRPNDGIWKSLENALNIPLILIFISVIGNLSALDKISIPSILNSIISGLGIGSMISILPFLIFGGRACILYFILRLFLYHNGYIPWNYARFLDYCTELSLLQRVGGRYRFIHRMLQEHFAQMPFEKIVD